jgi:glycosyltransferase involved in cell wall biosynthesis
MSERSKGSHPRDPEGAQPNATLSQKEHIREGGLVTVVIPCYNQAHFLGEAIESVLAQSYPNFEIIVVDDGSTDNTSEVASGYPSEKVRLLGQKNKGRSAARNLGLRQSRGEYVVFLDSDDRLLPEALEVGERELEAHPECAFVSGHIRRIGADGSPLRTPPQALHKAHVKDHYARLLRYNYIWTTGPVMYRRSVFDTVDGFDSSLEPCEDWDIYLRIAGGYPVHHHGEVVAEYRQHDANTTHDSTLMLKATVAVLRAQKKRVRGHERYEKACETGLRGGTEYYGVPLADEVREYLRQREWKRAFRGVLVLLRYYPWGLTLLEERRMARYREQDAERRELARRLRNSKQELEAHERRLQELGSARELEGAIAKERQETKLLRRRIRHLKQRMQNLDQRAFEKPLKKLRHLRAKVLKRRRKILTGR